MKIYEFDWRSEPLRDALTGLEHALQSVEIRMSEEPWFDGEAALDHAETVLGLVLVAAQSYALATWTDLNRLRSSEGRVQLVKLRCCATDTAAVAPGVTRIQLVNAAANYFKHHDEWLSWPDNETTRSLAAAAITDATGHPCAEAMRLLCGESWSMSCLHQLLVEWRAHVFQVLR